MEKTGCNNICGAPKTLAVKGLMMMMMMMTWSLYEMSSILQHQLSHLNTCQSKLFHNGEAFSFHGNLNKSYILVYTTHTQTHTHTYTTHKHTQHIT